MYFFSSIVCHFFLISTSILGDFSVTGFSHRGAQWRAVHKKNSGGYTQFLCVVASRPYSIPPFSQCCDMTNLLGIQCNKGFVLSAVDAQTDTMAQRISECNLLSSQSTRYCVAGSICRLQCAAKGVWGDRWPRRLPAPCRFFWETIFFLPDGSLCYFFHLVLLRLILDRGNTPDTFFFCSRKNLVARGPVRGIPHVRLASKVPGYSHCPCGAGVGVVDWNGAQAIGRCLRWRLGPFVAL